MSWLREVALFFVGLLVAIWLFSNTVLPIVYGLPVGLWWVLRGWLRPVWAPLTYLIAPIIWIVLAVGALTLLYIFWPAALESTGLNIGIGFAFLGTAWRLFTKESRRDLRQDFVDTMGRYLTWAGFPHAVALLPPEKQAAIRKALEHAAGQASEDTS
jgi:hypothetical protein